MKLTKLQRITELFARFARIRKDKEALFAMLDEVEIAERVYNSNAIENSTLTLPETEKILLHQETSRRISLREIFETKNLALVYGYIKKIAVEMPLTIEGILLLHKMLLTNIDDTIAGRFRTKGEMVRVGNHIGLPPEFIHARIEELFVQFTTEVQVPVIHRVATFHAAFESIHPFIDGNGRIGRVLVNYFLLRESFPPIIVRNKEKASYYSALRMFDNSKNSKPMIHIVELAVLESLHKRLAYGERIEILPLSVYAEKSGKPFHSLLNMARRQTIPAFREKGVWKIGDK